MRRPIVAGNWKMNPPSQATAIALAQACVRGVASQTEVTSVLCPPAIFLAAVAHATRDSDVLIGAQTMHHDERGAYTGEVSPLMLQGLAAFVIVGHSERRQYNGETDEAVGLKVASAVAHGLRPIACIGETAAQRRAGETSAVIDRQLHAAVGRLGRVASSGLVIAYEPVWAIGTGDAATGADAQAVAAQIRDILRATDASAADEVPIQYGGSVTPHNAGEFFAQPDIDGALVGGSSLLADAFVAIVEAAGRTAPQRA